MREEIELGINFATVRLRTKFMIFFLSIICTTYSIKLAISTFNTQSTKIIVKADTTDKLLPFRKNIIDRDERILATSLPVNSIAISPHKISNIESTVYKLAKVFPEINKKKLTKLLSSNRKFVWIKRNITPKQEKKLNLEGIPGLLFEKDYKRFYPYSNLTAFLVGYVDIDENGIAGIEKSFDTTIKDNTERKAESLKLTIDVRLQEITKNVLSEHIKSTSADGGIGIITDITSGEILSMVSIPDFNPHNPSSHKTEELFNRASLGVYELGSVFKPVTIASAFDSNSITLTDLFDSTPPLKIGKYSIGDFVTSREKFLTPEKVLVKSSNIGTARIALKMGLTTQRTYIERFGLFKDIEVGLQEKGHPLWPKKWSEINSVTISYGHGFAITPLHLAQVFGGIMNSGLNCPLHLLKSSEEPLCERIVSKDTSKKMRNLLRQVVLQGSGKKAEVDGYCLGGKTGTSSKIHNGHYVKNESITSFIGVFPMHEPKYLILISIDNPKGGKFDTTGGAVSAPVAHDIIEQMASVLNLVPEPERCFF